MTRRLVDTNCILRFLTGEPEKQALRAKKLFAQSDSGEIILRIVPLVVAEVVFVLSGSVYGFSRREVVDSLIPFLETPTLEVEKRDVLIDALERFRDHAIDYVDACLAAEAAATQCEIASFDGDFRKFKDITLRAP